MKTGKGLEHSTHKYELTEIFNQDSLVRLLKFFIMLSLNSKFHSKTTSDGEGSTLRGKKWKKYSASLRSYNYLKINLMIL